MFHINHAFTQLPGSYLFAETAKRTKAYEAALTEGSDDVLVEGRNGVFVGKFVHVK